MKKFLVLYKAPNTSFEQMMKATPAQQKAGMEAWMVWAQKAGPSLVDMGAPLGKSLRVNPTGASQTQNDLGGYSIMQAESKEALGESLKGHPTSGHGRVHRDRRDDAHRACDSAPNELNAAGGACACSGDSPGPSAAARICLATEARARWES